MNYKIGDLFVARERSKYEMSERWTILSIDKLKYLIGLKKNNDYHNVQWMYEEDLDRKFIKVNKVGAIKPEYSSVEIRLYNHKTGKVLYQRLTMEQLEHILKVIDPSKWI